MSPTGIKFRQIMCAKSSSAIQENSSAPSKSGCLTRLSRWGDNVAATNQVLKSLVVYKLSGFFNYYRIHLYESLNRAKISVSGYEFELSEHFLNYFSFDNVDLVYEIASTDPVAVTRVKKLFNVLLTSENFLKKLEQHDSLNFFSIKIFVSELKDEARHLATKVLELTSDCFNLFEHDANTILSLMYNILTSVQLLIDGHEVNNPNLSEVYHSLNRYLGAISHSVEHVDFKILVGSSFGCAISLMGPDDQNKESIAELLTKIPAFFNQLSEKIEWLTQELAHKHSRNNAPALKDFQRQTKLILDQLANLSLGGISFSFDLFSLLNNCMQLLELYQSLQSRFGLLQESSQRFVLEHFRALKYQFLLPIFNYAVDIELDLKLKPGQITDKFAPYVERFYWSLINLTRDNIEFKEADEELLFLFEQNFNLARVTKIHQLYSDVKLKLFHFEALFETFKNLQKDEKHPIHSKLDLSDLRKHIHLFLPYIKKADDQWYNDIIDHPESFHRPSEQEKLIYVLSQEQASLKLQLLEIETMLDVFRAQEETSLFFLQWPDNACELSLSNIRRRYKGTYLLIQHANEYFFYDKNKTELKKLPLELMDLGQEQSGQTGVDNVLYRCSQRQQSCIELAIQKEIFSENTGFNFEIELPAQNRVPHTFEELQKLLKHLILQKLYLVKTKEKVVAFFNFIQVHAQSYPEMYLTENWRNHLIRLMFHFRFSFKSFDSHLPSLLASEQLIKLSHLQQIAISEQRQILGLMDAHFAQLSRDKHLIQTEYFKVYNEDFRRKYQPVKLERVGYFLNSTRGSQTCKWIRERLDHLFELYHPAAQEYMTKGIDGYYSELLDDGKVIMSFPKQVVDAMIIYNSFALLEKFFINFESLMLANFTENIANLLTKLIYLISDYVSLQNYVMTQFRSTYHLQLFKKFFSNLSAINDINQLPFEAFLPEDEHELAMVHSFTNLEKWIYWFLNSPDLIGLKAGEKPIISKSAPLDLIRSIRDIIGNKSSYSWLILKFGFYDIYKLVNGLRSRLADFNSAIYKITARQLFNLKTTLFAEFMLAIDDLEVDMGIKPEIFSDKASQIIDVLFEHFLISLNLDLVKFSQLMINSDIEEIRVRHFQRKIEETVKNRKDFEVISQRFSYFISFYEQVEAQRLLNPWDERIAETLKTSFFDILPSLIEFQSNRTLPNRPELMTPSELFWDEKIDSWLNVPEFKDKLKTKDYLNLIYSLSQFVIGLVNTAKLKIKLYTYKATQLSQQSKPSLAIQLMSYTNRQFDNYFQYLKSTRKHVCLKMNEFYIRDLEAFFEYHRSELVSKIYNKLLIEYRCQQSIQLDIPLQKSLLAQEYLNEVRLLIDKFDRTYNHYYFYLESVLETIEKFERYLGNVKSSLMQGRGDWFENDKTINTKLQQLSEVSKFILNAEGSLQDRVTVVQKMFKDNKEFKNIILNYAEVPGGGLLQYVFRLWQWLMLILIRFGFYTPEHHRVFNVLSDLKPSTTPIIFDVGRFNLFNGLNQYSMNERAPVALVAME